MAPQNIRHSYLLSDRLLGVSLSALSRWVRTERGSLNTAPVQKKVFNLLAQDELTRLRKEVAQLRMIWAAEGIVGRVTFCYIIKCFFWFS
jgi:hypothetical protein